MQDNKDTAEIIIKFITDRNGIFDNVHKYSSFLNNLLSKYMSSAFYIENIVNGVIYFFKNENNYFAVNLPYDKSIIDDFTNQKKKQKLEIMSDTLVPDNIISNYPKDGINFYFTLVKGDSERILPNSVVHFESYDPKNIEVERISHNKLKINIKTYKALEAYLYERLLLTTGLIEEYMK
jgi:hypothetical protein